MGFAERVGDPDDPLRTLLQAAKAWRVPPSVFIRLRTADAAAGWTEQDTQLAMALEDYEAGLCPGGNHPLAETSQPDHADAYRPGQRITCHYCKTEALIAEVAEKSQENMAGVLTPIVLDAEVVRRNRLPVPPLPPELAP